MSIAMMKKRKKVRPQLGSNHWTGGYKDCRANAPFVVCGDRICYKDRRANAPKLLKGPMPTRINSFTSRFVLCDLKVCSLWSVVFPQLRRSAIFVADEWRCDDSEGRSPEILNNEKFKKKSVVCGRQSADYENC